MDFEEWEYLSDDGFFDFHEDGEKKILQGKRNSDSKTVFDMNYFICPSPNPVPNELITLPIQFPHEDDSVKEVTKVPIEATIIKSGATIEASDQDTVSQVFFKMKENEFVDMKMDSPKSGSRGIVPQIDAGPFQFEDKPDSKGSKISSPRIKVDKDMVLEKHISDEEQEEEENWKDNSSGGLNLWKWSLTGIGAICSFGVAAATICIIFFGSQQRNKQIQQNQNHLGLHFYADDKRMKQVMQHATKLNGAISVARGIPLTTAHITFGGYYDDL